MTSVSTTEGLAAFLARAGRTPFTWGAHDCCLWLADWLVWRGYSDPAAWLRGTYDGEATCAAVLAEWGGLPRLVGCCARAVGLEEVARPRAGDIGLVEVWTTTGIAPAGALCAGPRWALLTRQGVISVRADPLTAWRV